jgi:peroxiredoxin
MELGDVVPNATLLDCSGEPHELRDLCPRTAAYVYTFAAWCETCQAYVASGASNALYEKYAASDFDLWLVVTATATNDPPDAAFCRLVAEQYGLSSPVMFDASGALASALGMPVNSGELVLTRGNLVRRTTWGAHASVPDTLADIFGF